MLAPGTKLGSYEIIASLGVGGMGEVYRARDPRLDRIVAIKVLPTAFSSDAERLHRFEREARAASALNHPNIVTIYELGDDGEAHFFAMELVEGQTLRDLIAAGALPIRKAIEIAAQIAEGLAKAHEAGIAHRDIKPTNLMLSTDGYVKILDFGLAKVAATDPGSDRTDAQTLSEIDTRPGSIFGTPEYMSPEQASGRKADYRSDQFSFGLVLYEMITGKRAFRRGTTAETMVAILKDQAEPIGALAPDAPAPLCWAIERCLAKEPQGRYVSSRDLARELAAIRDRLSEAPAKQMEARPSNLPTQRTGFVGREKEVAAVQELLLRKNVRLLTVTGPGGIGKTRLAVQVANGIAEHFPGGIHFVPLSPLNDPELIASVIVQTLGLRGTGGQPPLEILKKNLEDPSRPASLLVLDNFEHLMKAAAALAELLAAGPCLKILVTSRAALHVYGEREFPVPPLALPDLKAMPSVEELSRFPAIALFMQRAVAAKPDFELNKENATAVAEICARLDGLPLAIELAAARIKVLSAASLRTRLASRLQLLTGGARDLPERQQTLRAAIDWSFDLLNAPEQKLFRRLSVFVGGCTLESAEAACDTKADLDLDLLDGMASMVDKSLLQQIEQPSGETRFAMLETIREYGREKLAASSEEAATKRAHAAYCMILAEEGASHLGGADGAEWLKTLTTEHDNFRAAMEFLTDSGNAEWGLRLGAALFRFWETREFFAEGRDRLGKLLKLPAAAAHTKTRARGLFAAGVLAIEQRDYASGEKLLQESLTIARELGDTQGVAVCLNALAVIARERGDAASARALFEENLILWRELGDEIAVARCLSNLANVAKLEGGLAKARSLYEEALAIFKRLGDHSGVAWSLNYEGDVARDQGDAADAKDFYQQALTIFRDLGDSKAAAGTLADLGNLAVYQQDFGSARTLFRESLKIFQELEQKRGIARLLECFASVAACQSQPEDSLRLAGTAAALRQNLGAPLTAEEQAKLESALQSARSSLNNTAGADAWLEGWSMPVDKTIERAMIFES